MKGCLCQSVILFMCISCLFLLVVISCSSASENQVIEHVRRYLAVAVGFSSEQAYSDELCLLFVHCLEVSCDGTQHPW